MSQCPIRRIVRMEPDPNSLNYACEWHVGETRDGLVQCGKPGQIWVVGWYNGRWRDFHYCPGCYAKFRDVYPEAPAFELVPLLY